MATSKPRLAALTAVLFLAACTTPAPQTASLAENCVAQGGKHTVERSAYGSIGVCIFADNRQCEEWALLRGQCPRGGVPVGGYATTTERHCAIRGGNMTIPGCALSPVGTYETRAASSMTLTLEAGRVAMLTSTRPNRYMVSGTWESSGNSVSVSTEHERLVFDYTGDQLVPREWDRKTWGAAGPGTLVRTQ